MKTTTEYTFVGILLSLIKSRIALRLFLQIPVFTFLLVFHLQAQTIINDSLAKTNTLRPKIGLALSGGAAHGIAHIGVIKYLHEQGIPVDYITGTSMGAVVGSLYALGKSPKELEDVCSSINWDDLFTGTYGLDEVVPIEKYFHEKYPANIYVREGEVKLPQGFLKTDKLEMTLSKLLSPAIGIHDFNQLPRPFACFAVDLERGEVVKMDHGRLALAVRASLAIPSVFSPRIVDDRLLIDGGLIRNFPVTDVQEMGADFVIGSYVGRDGAKREEINSLIDILSESAFLMSVSDSKKQFKAADILIKPNVKEEPIFEFSNYKKLIEEGYLAAKEQDSLIQELKKVLIAYPKPEPVRKLKANQYVFIDKIIIDTDRPDFESLILDNLKIDEKTFVSFEYLERGIRRINATQNFEQVIYTLDAVNNDNVLTIDANALDDNKLGVAINHFNSTNSSLVLHAQLRNFLGQPSNLQLVSRISEQFGIYGRYFLRQGFQNRNMLFGVEGKVERFDFPMFLDDEKAFDGYSWERLFRPFVMYEVTKSFSVRLDYLSLSGILSNEVKKPIDFEKFKHHQNRVGIKLEYNSMHRPFNSLNGLRMILDGGYAFHAKDDLTYNDPMGETILNIPTSEGFSEVFALFDHVVSFHPKSAFRMSFASYYKNNPSFIDNVLVGGVIQDDRKKLPFMGMQEGQLNLSQLIYGRLEVQIRPLPNFTVAIVSNYIQGESVTEQYLNPELDASVWRWGNGLSFRYVSVLGPLQLDIGHEWYTDEIKAQFGLGYRHIF